MDKIEATIESLCNQILKSDQEDWESKNKSLLQITDIISNYQDHSQNEINEIFSQNIFRSLKEPIKLLVFYFINFL